MSAREMILRPAVDEDRAGVLALCRRSLGWRDTDPDEAFFRWKHDENAFGRSAAWVAVDPEADDRIVGLRMFLRWRFRDVDGSTVSAVRAVDTATDPDWQGRGIFTKLTTGAMPSLLDEGADVIFNTPNDKSRPGYLKMGWSVVGQVPVGARFRSPGVIRRVVTARTAADLWSEPVTCGLDAATAFDDEAETAAMLDRARRPDGLATDRTPDFLAWRYRFGPLHYRVLPLGDSLASGAIVFRVRRRGEATEATVCDVIAPPGARLSRAFAHLARTSRADYLLATGNVGLRQAFLPMPRLGPVLTWRPMGRPGIPPMSSLALTMGDIELF